eukprot:scaffold3659_cov348-Pavlova_lutheri.AAC.1
MVFPRLPCTRPVPFADGSDLSCDPPPRASCHARPTLHDGTVIASFPPLGRSDLPATRWGQAPHRVPWSISPPPTPPTPPPLGGSVIRRGESESELGWSWIVCLLGELGAAGSGSSPNSPFFGRFGQVSYLSVFPFPLFGVPVPRGRSAALGEVSRRGVVWGPHHLPVVFRLYKSCKAEFGHFESTVRKNAPRPIQRDIVRSISTHIRRDTRVERKEHPAGETRQDPATKDPGTCTGLPALARAEPARGPSIQTT